MSGFDAAAFAALRRGSWGAAPRLHKAVTSTQDLAREAAPEGTVFLAEAQDAGRGRWGRRWDGADGKSLLFSVRLDRDAGAGPESSLPLILGAATAAALRGLGLEQAGLKWPNDILADGRKLGGLLVEGTGAAWIAGCGLNVGQAGEDFPPELRATAGSLRMAGLESGREAVLAAVLADWEAWMGRWRREGFAALRAEVEALLLWRGRACRVRLDHAEAEGTLLGLTDDGALRLGLDGDGERVLHSAEILALREAGPH